MHEIVTAAPLLKVAPWENSPPLHRTNDARSGLRYGSGDLRRWQRSCRQLVAIVVTGFRLALLLFQKSIETGSVGAQQAGGSCDIALGLGEGATDQDLFRFNKVERDV